MSFKNVDFSQDVLNEQALLQAVKDYPERFFDGEKQRGRFGTVYILVPGVFAENYFVKTTVSDVLNVCGKINITWLAVSEPSGVGMEHLRMRYLCNLSVASPKHYRGVLKFTPKNTLSLKMWIVGTDKNGNDCVVPLGDYPMLQDEKFVNASVDNAYNNDDEGTDYGYIERHAFRMLCNDKRFIGDKGLYKCISPDAEGDLSVIVHEMICRYYEVTESWGVCYSFNGNMFVFPMRQEYLKETLRGRERVDGRRRTLPTVVKKHNRKGNTVSSHLRAADKKIIVGGREFEIVVGRDSYSQIFPDNAYGEKAKARIKKSTVGTQQEGSDPCLFPLVSELSGTV